jgi:hypothetical protein
VCVCVCVCVCVFCVDRIFLKEFDEIVPAYGMGGGGAWVVDAVMRRLRDQGDSPGSDQVLFTVEKELGKGARQGLCHCLV